MYDGGTTMQYLAGIPLAGGVNSHCVNIASKQLNLQPQRRDQAAIDSQLTERKVVDASRPKAG